eukprot:scaffold103283_cov28-Prasinocladus_malaysianus.AAC.1
MHTETHTWPTLLLRCTEVCMVGSVGLYLTGTTAGMQQTKREADNTSVRFSPGVLVENLQLTKTINVCKCDENEAVP